MTGQTLGDRVRRYNAGGVQGPRDRPRPGGPSALDEGRQAAPKAPVLRGPDLRRDGCVAWRARDPCALVEARFGVRYRESGMLKLLKGLDLSWQKARPVHPEADPRAQERFKKTCPAWSRGWRASTPGNGSSCGSWTRRGSGRRAASRTCGTRRGCARADGASRASPRPTCSGPCARGAARG